MYHLRIMHSISYIDFNSNQLANILPFLAALLAAVLLVCAGHRACIQRPTAQPLIKEQKAQRTENTKDRPPGEWTPVNFDYPRVEPCARHFSTLKPIPYRPFKWGDYHVTMGIRSMRWDEWLELDNEFEQTHRVAAYRIQTGGDRLVQVHPAQPGIVASGHEAAEECMYEIAEYLAHRHPDVYRVTRGDGTDGWYSAGRIKTITIVPFEETYDLEKEEPLKVARLLIQEDFTIMMEGSDGRYYLQAGAVVIAGSWRLSDKMGMPLEDIHISGNVPQYKTKLQMSMDRFFRRMPLEKPVVRNNYSFQVVAEPSMRDPPPAPGSLLDVDPEELAWAVTMNGDEDETRESEETGSMFKLNQAKCVATAGTVRLRTERQTLRRLGRTGAIVFTIRVYQTRLDELAKEPGVPGRAASAIRSWPEDVARYKARGAYEEILPYLDACHAEQVAQGVIREGGEEEEYPF